MLCESFQFHILEVGHTEERCAERLEDERKEEKEKQLEMAKTDSTAEGGQVKDMEQDGRNMEQEERSDGDSDVGKENNGEDDGSKRIDVGDERRDNTDCGGPEVGNNMDDC